jgi:16S rRNA (cytidine1402-2'-O)-methyltransferase
MAQLSVVSTPIGNLEDITLRALRVLSECDVVACEDTRVTAKLLARHRIEKSLLRLDAHASHRAIMLVEEALRDGKHVAVVVDAGVPGISDPGNAIVARVLSDVPEVEIVPIPGPSALTAIVSVSGLPFHHFLFLGFLPKKRGRQAIIDRIAMSEDAVVLFESPHRIVRTLESLVPVLGDRSVVVGRELTKMFETIVRGTAPEVLASIASGSMKGEFVVAIAGRA